VGFFVVVSGLPASGKTAVARPLAQVLNLPSGSLHWANQSLELARRVGDTQPIRDAPVNKAMILTDRRDGRVTFAPSAAALVDQTRQCAEVRVQALQQAAHGHAIDVALDEAAAVRPLVTTTIPGSTPAGGPGRLSDHAPGVAKMRRLTRLRPGPKPPSAFRASCGSR
jgi:hypothetical protein